MNRPVVLITGSSHGIGKAAALKFAKEGYRVVINGNKDEKALKAAEEEINRITPCISFLGNVGNPEDVSRMFQMTEKEFGRIDCLINNAGISYVGLLTDMAPKQWEELIATNLSAAFYTSRLAVLDMLKRKQGKIINISSVWGNVGASCETAYSASKGGINSFTRALAKELAPSNIQVNAVALGAIDTRMNHFLSEDERKMLEDEIPAGRLATVEEAADFIYSMAHQPEYFTGQIVTFDGGWT